MRTSSTGQPLLNIAQFWPATHALGPGLRSVAWVQGCNRHCPSCISPEWAPQVDAHVVPVENLAELLISNPNIGGVTFSGGEPMLQAEELAALICLIHQKRDLNIICFTGFTYDQLRQKPGIPGAERLLAEVDVLIDGPYIVEQDDNRGLRGSANQKVHHLTDRLQGYDFETGPRKVEFHIQNNYTMMVGIPAWDVQRTLEQSIKTKGQR